MVTTFGTGLVCRLGSMMRLSAGLAALSAIAAAAMPALAAAAERATIVQEGDSVVLIPPKAATPFANDYANARGRSVPKAAMAATSPVAEAVTPADPRKLFGPAGSAAGGVGDGKTSPVRVAPARNPSEASISSDGDDPAQPEEFGLSNRPFTTNRVDPADDVITDSYPFRAAGRLFFKIDGDTYVCSAALIKPGIVVTAAHCVVDFGQRGFFSDFEFVPAYTNGIAPYGVWKAARVRVRRSYVDGTALCDPTAPGVVCRNDVALIRLEAQGGAYPGTSTGWFGYGWNGYGFTSAGVTHITQLGYPVSLDHGLLMQRTDSQGVVSPERAGNTLIGSLMGGGSSGGPWVLNLGIAPTLSNTFLGYGAARNTIVGVTSWGYMDPSVKEQGASPFTSSNIVPMVDAECAAVPAACS